MAGDQGPDLPSPLGVGLGSDGCGGLDSLREARTTSDGETIRKPIDLKDWAKALETVLDSMKTRKVDQPGSRAYLEFAREFVKEARERP